jgi:hypothetical protein
VIASKREVDSCEGKSGSTVLVSVTICDANCVIYVYSCVIEQVVNDIHAARDGPTDRR